MICDGVDEYDDLVDNWNGKDRPKTEASTAAIEARDRRQAAEGLDRMLSSRDHQVNGFAMAPVHERGLRDILRDYIARRLYGGTDLLIHEWYILVDLPMSPGVRGHAYFLKRHFARKKEVVAH